MRCGRHPHISVIGPKVGREHLRNLLVKRGFHVATWSLSQGRALLDDVGDDGHLIVILIVEDSASSATACQFLLRHLPRSALLLLCHDDPDELQTDLDGIMIRSASSAPMATILGDPGKHGVMNGIHRPVTPAKMQAATRNAVHLDLLSTREAEILACLADGQANKRIARKLNITESTVKVHVKTILRKLHLTNRTQAAIWAVQHGLTSDWELPPARLASADDQGHAMLEDSPTRENYPMISWF